MMERARIVLFMGIAGSGLLIFALSFLPWLHFQSEGLEGSGLGVSIHLAGTETSRLRDLEVINIDTVQEEDGWCSCRVDFGDGFLTAGLGILIVAGAGLALLWRRYVPGAAAAVTGGLLALAVGGFNAIADWQALAWTEGRHLEAVSGSVQPALLVLVIIAGVASVISVVTLVLPSPERLDSEYEDELPDEGDYLAKEGIEAWA
jgi:hypothetical protein